MDVIFGFLLIIDRRKTFARQFVHLARNGFDCQFFVDGFYFCSTGEVYDYSQKFVSNYFQAFYIQVRGEVPRRDCFSHGRTNYHFV